MWFMRYIKPHDDPNGGTSKQSIKNQELTKKANLIGHRLGRKSEGEYYRIKLGVWVKEGGKSRWSH